MSFTFRIDGSPFGKPAVSRTRTGIRYRNQATTAFYSDVAYMARRAPGFKRCLAPCVTIAAVKQRPQREPKDYPLPWTDGRNPCLAKPDPDNVAKAICDGLRYAGAYRDDALISMLLVTTYYAAVGESAHTTVSVYDLADPGGSALWGGSNNGDNRENDAE